MATLLKWIFGIILGIFIFGAIASYTDNNTQVLTETPEQSAMDEEKPVSKIGVFDCLTNTDGVITPDQEHLYSLNKMTVFQSLPNGVLIEVAPNIEVPIRVKMDTAFLKTDRDFADGAMLNGYLAAFRGTYEYNTKDERNKKVLAFKLVNKTSSEKKWR